MSAAMSFETAEAFVTAWCRFRASIDAAAYWTARYERGPPPRLPRFDPVDVPRLLPRIYLLERVGERLRYRVSGEEVNRLFDSQHTGRHLDEVAPPEIYPVVAPFFFRVLDGRVCLFNGNVILPSKSYLEFERLLLPVERDGTTMLLGILSLSSMGDRLPGRPPAPPVHEFRIYDPTSGAVEETMLDVRSIQKALARSAADGAAPRPF